MTVTDKDVVRKSAGRLLSTAHSPREYLDARVCRAVKRAVAKPCFLRIYARPGAALLSPTSHPVPPRLPWTTAVKQVMQQPS